MPIENGSTKTYRALARPLFLSGCFFHLMLCMAIVEVCSVVGLTGTVLMINTLLNDLIPGLDSLLVLLFIFSLVIALFIGTLLTWSAVVLTGRFFRTLKVSPSGLEYRCWPYSLQCAWEEVQGFSGVRGPLGQLTFLRLSNAKPSGLWHFFGRLEVIRLWPKAKYVVQLTGLEGWPAGGLADDLRRYAPHAFEDTIVGHLS